MLLGVNSLTQPGWVGSALVWEVRDQNSYHLLRMAIRRSLAFLGLKFQARRTSGGAVGNPTPSQCQRSAGTLRCRTTTQGNGSAVLVSEQSKNLGHVLGGDIPLYNESGLLCGAMIAKHVRTGD